MKRIRRNPLSRRALQAIKRFTGKVVKCPPVLAKGAESDLKLRDAVRKARAKWRLANAH